MTIFRVLILVLASMIIYYVTRPALFPLSTDDKSTREFKADTTKHFLTENKPVRSNKAKPVVQLQQASSAHNSIHFDSHRTEFNCKNSNRGSIKKNAAIKAYKWVDEKGKVHFGDKPPEQVAVESLEFEGSLNYFDLSINDEQANLKVGFRDTLSIGITKSYEVLADFLPANILQRVEVNLWIFDEEADYIGFRQQYAPHLVGKNIGFHNSLFNISGVHAVNDYAVNQTSIHESVHVIIGGVFGLIPRWLNEGLAEYLDVMRVYGQAIEIQPKYYWLKHLSKTPPFDIKRFVTISHKEWMQLPQERLYAQSWALTYFLMSDNTEKMLLKHYLSASARSPCELKNFSEFASRYYKGGFAELEKRYLAWLNSDIVPHQY